MTVSKGRFGLRVLLVVALAAVAGESWAQPTMDKQAPRTDLHGDPLPEGAIGRLGTLRFRHPTWPSDLVFQADGKQLVSACWDGRVHVWDTSTGREVHSFRPLVLAPAGKGFAALLAVALSPDGKTVLGADNQQALHFWDIASGKEVRSLHARSGSALAFSADGKTLAVGEGVVEAGKQLALWDLTTGKELRHLGEAMRRVGAIAFSAEGKLLAAGDGCNKDGNEVEDPRVRLWDLATGRQLRALEGHTGRITALAFSPDGRRLASCSHDSTLRLWDLATGNLIRAVGVRDDTLFLAPYEGKQGTAHGGLLTLAYSPDGKLLASGSADGTVRLWDPEEVEELHILRGHGREVTRVAFSSDGKLLASASKDHTIRLWDAVRGKPLLSRPGQDGAVSNLAVSRDGQLVAAVGEDRRIHLWSVPSGKHRFLLSRHKGPISSVAFWPDGQRLASADQDGSIRLWNTATGKPLPPLWETSGAVHSLAFASGPNLLLSASSGNTIDCLDASTTRIIRQIETNGQVGNVQTSAAGTIVTAADEAGLRVWDVATGKELRCIRGNYPQIALSADGRLLATGSPQENTIRLWEAATGQQVGSLTKQVISERRPGVFQLVFSPDGRLLARAGPNDSVELWETPSGKLRRKLRGHLAEVRSLAFSPDGLVLYSGSQDTTILVWDVARRHERRPARLSDGELQGLWRDLAGEDADRADRAICTLTVLPEQSVPFLAQRLRPWQAADGRLLARLLADLDSDDFAVRQKATHDLEQLRELARPALRQALKQSPTLEARRRIELLLRKPRGPVPAGELLRSLRAVEVLEHVGTPEAQRLLRHLTTGAAESWLTEDARAALDRLGHRPTGKQP